MLELTKGQKFLLKKKNELDTDTIRLMNEGKIRYGEGDFYIRAQITSASNLKDLVTDSDDQRDGVRSFNGNQLPNQEHLALQYLGLRIGKEANTVTDPAAVTKWTVLKDDVPAALLNADIIISQGGNTLVKMPVARFFAESKPDTINGKEDVVELNAIQLIKARTPLKIQIQFADGQSVPDATTNHHYLEIRLMGDKTLPR